MSDTGDIVRRAADGDQVAWNSLVDRYAGLVWSVARAHRLSTPDAADVVQTTWLRLVEHLGRLRDPDRVGAWLATTARHESLRVIRRSARQAPAPDDGDLDLIDVDQPAPDARLLGKERDRLLWRAFETLPDRCRMLLRMLLADPPPGYDEISAAMDMPIGSIGPTRGRCLDRLRRSAEVAAISGRGSA